MGEEIYSHVVIQLYLLVKSGVDLVHVLLDLFAKFSVLAQIDIALDLWREGGDLRFEFLPVYTAEEAVGFDLVYGFGTQSFREVYIQQGLDEVFG